MTLAEIARITGGTVEGDANAEIARLAKIEEAGQGDITFYANPRYGRYLPPPAQARCSYRRARRGRSLPCARLLIALVEVPDAYLAFLKLIDVFHPPLKPMARGIHPTAVIAASARIGADPAFGPHVVIGEGCVIGARADDPRGHGAVQRRYPRRRHDALRECHRTRTVPARQPRGRACGGRDLERFRLCSHPDRQVRKDSPAWHRRHPNTDVEIGANTAIDRATIGETRIKAGAKLDNLIQIAHNVVIGKNTVMAALTGVSGSTKIGDDCQIGGQAGRRPFEYRRQVGLRREDRCREIGGAHRRNILRLARPRQARSISH